MPITKKQLLPQNLTDIDVLIEDTSENSPYFNISKLPQVFTGGRNSFLIAGSQYLQDKSTILIEVLDSQNKPIYNSVVAQYIEGNSRMVTVEIYDTTPPGFCTIVIMAKAITTSTLNPVPNIWKNKYNVRWTKRVLVDYNLKNTSPLLFLRAPTLFTTENRFFDLISSSYDTYDIPFTASLMPVYIPQQQVGYRITATAPSKFSPEYLGGIITGSLNIGTNPSTDVSLTIDDIKDDTVAFTYNNLILSSINNGIIKKLSLLRSGSYTESFDGITYPVTTSIALRYNTITTSSVNIPLSYASLRIANLTTVSGEIYKCRIYNKLAGNRADYKLIGDVYVDTQEIMVTSSVTGNIPIGDIRSAYNFQNNWYAGTLEKNTNIRAQVFTVSGSATYYDPQIVSNRLVLSASNSTLLSSIYTNVPINLSTNKFANSVSESGYFIGTIPSYTLFSTTEYTFSVDAYYRKSSGSVTLTGNDFKVDIYVVGTNGTRTTSNDPLGQKIGELTVNGDVQWFRKKQFNFIPTIPSVGTVGLRFVVRNGFWNFSNISIKPASDPQFSPDEVQILIPNGDYYNQLLQYKIEFFDINNNSANINAISTPAFFTGSAIDLGTLI